MSNASDYLENRILTDLKSMDLYIALFDGDPTEEGTGGTELTSPIKGTPDRQVIVFGAITNDGAGKKISNSVDTVISTSAATDCHATHYGIFDDVNNGNLVVCGSLTASKSINAGDAVKLLAGTIIIKAS